MDDRYQTRPAKIAGDDGVLCESVEGPDDGIAGTVIIDNDKLVKHVDFAGNHVSDVDRQRGVGHVNCPGDVHLVMAVRINTRALVTIKFNEQR